MANETQSSGGYAGGSGGGGVTSIVAGTNITISPVGGTGAVTINSTGGGSSITVVANYSALPAAGTVTGLFYWCEASQGTSWLPGALGGTYYSAGMYYSNGVTWEFTDIPYQATQAEVNTGTNTDKFVTPATLANATGFLKNAIGISGGTTLIGGTATTDKLTFRTTSNSGGTTGSDFIWQGGNNGATELMRLLSPAEGSSLLLGTPTVVGIQCITNGSTRAAINTHAFEDTSVISLSGSTGNGYCSFDSIPNITSATDVGHFVSIQSRLKITANAGVTGWMRGLDVWASGSTVSGSGTIAEITGVRVQALPITTKTITGMYGVAVEAMSYNTTSGKMGFSCGAITGTGTANYGINLGAVSGATTNYAIYSNGGNSYLDDSVTIGGVNNDNDKFLQIKAKTSGKLTYFGFDPSTRAAGTPLWAVGRTNAANNNFIIQTYDGASTVTERFKITPTGLTGIGIDPTAVLHLKAGTATASTSPLKFTSGTALSSPEAGAFEFTTDNPTFTITTGTARKNFVLDDGTLFTANYVPYATTNGRLTSASSFKYDGTTLMLGGVSAVTDKIAIVGSDANRISIVVQNTNNTGNASFYFQNNRGSFLAYGGLLTCGSSHGGNFFGVGSADKTYLIADGTNSTGLGLGTLVSQPIIFGTNNNERARFIGGGQFGLGVTVPTAILHLKAGTATASTAPLKLSSGTNLTTAEVGAIEYDGANLFFTRTGTTRESVMCANAVNSVFPTVPNRTITVIIDGTTYYISAKTTND